MTINTPTTITSPLLIITGLSGAGMSTALKDIEDLGYDVFDNFPLTLLDSLIADPAAAGRPIAVGIDTRARGFDALAILDAAQRHKARVIFMTADDAVLQQRFTQTRRRHPLAKDRPVSAGIKREQELLHKLKANADIVIDTTDLSVHDLKRLLKNHCALEGAQKSLTVTLMSFGFRFGLPRDADTVFDARFLRNPYWVMSMRPLSGLDKPVADYVESDDNFNTFVAHIKSLMGPLLPLYAQEGKSYFTLAIGCTGGRHRSVHIVETLKPWLEKQGVTMNVIHRDIERDH